MTKENHTGFSDFILLGFSELQDLQVLLFVVFLLIYAGIITGNGLIVYITVTDSALQIPMYTFLRSLSFVEICYTSVTVPKLLGSFMVGKRRISFNGCLAQIYFLLLLGGTECLLLAAMAYDRYVAICNPLHYIFIMNKQFCSALIILSVLVNVPIHGGQIYLVVLLPFCGSHEINNLFCDIPTLLELACADTNMNRLIVFAVAIFVLIIPFFLILASYVRIICAVLKMSSAESQKKAFATCSSHLIVVLLFYGSASIVYLTPWSKKAVSIKKLLSLFYIILVPMFNPIIYTLRNREVKASLQKLFRTAASNAK